MEKITKRSLWNRATNAVNQSIADMTELVMYATRRIGFYDDVRNSKDYGLYEMCENLQGLIIDLHDKITEIKVSCLFLEDKDVDKEK